MEPREAEIRACANDPVVQWVRRDWVCELLGWLDEARRERDEARHDKDRHRKEGDAYLVRALKGETEVARLTAALEHLRDDPSLGRMGRAIIDEALAGPTPKEPA